MRDYVLSAKIWNMCLIFGMKEDYVEHISRPSPCPPFFHLSYVGFSIKSPSRSVLPKKLPKTKQSNLRKWLNKIRKLWAKNDAQNFRALWKKDMNGKIDHVVIKFHWNFVFLPQKYYEEWKNINLSWKFSCASSGMVGFKISGLLKIGIRVSQKNANQTPNWTWFAPPHHSHFNLHHSVDCWQKICLGNGWNTGWLKDKETCKKGKRTQ